jgi:hypothetical protein
LDCENVVWCHLTKPLPQNSLQSSLLFILLHNIFRIEKRWGLASDHELEPHSRFSQGDKSVRKAPRSSGFSPRRPILKPSVATRGSPGFCSLRLGLPLYLADWEVGNAGGFSASKWANRHFVIGVDHDLKALKKFGKFKT